VAACTRESRGGSPAPSAPLRGLVTLDRQAVPRPLLRPSLSAGACLRCAQVLFNTPDSQELSSNWGLTAKPSETTGVAGCKKYGSAYQL